MATLIIIVLLILNIPIYKAYFIYNDNQLKDLIAKMPRNKEELKKVSGFGEVKANKYGNDILKIIEKY
jgi:superfamily II DNA helicase RecQ